MRIYIVYLPSIDIFPLKRFSVQLSPGPQMFQPGHNLLQRPERYGFTDQQVMLLHHSTAPVIHQHYHLKTQASQMQRNYLFNKAADGETWIINSYA